MKKLIVLSTIALCGLFAHAEEKLIRIYDNQKTLGTNVFAQVQDQLMSGLMFPSEVVKGAPQGCPFADGKAGFVIIVEENEKCPVKMVCAPEEGEVRVNLVPLKKDNPDRTVLERRVMKLIWRGLCFANGAGYTRMPPCLLKPTDGSLKAIDDLGSCCPCPEAFNNLMMGCAKRGIGPTARTPAPAEEEEEE